MCLELSVRQQDKGARLGRETPERRGAMPLQGARTEWQDASMHDSVALLIWIRRAIGTGERNQIVHDALHAEELVREVRIPVDARVRGQALGQPLCGVALDDPV